MNISEKFRLKNIIEYPPCNKKMFEEYFYNEYSNNQPSLDRIYLPIFWTNYYISRNYGQGDISDLQEYLDNLDRSKKYFTIIQYDDNILNDLKDLDILIFAQGGYGKYKNKSYPISLNCQQEESNTSIKKDIFASFFGRKTHRIRETLFDKLKNNAKYEISDSIDYISFKNKMYRSVFSLCPRGYGLTSFRICEALHCNSIPVYIYDEPFLPFANEFDFRDVGITIQEDEIKYIDDILHSKTEEQINNYIINGKKQYEKYFTYSGVYDSIIKILTNTR